jgi:hypothetical protein
MGYNADAVLRRDRSCGFRFHGCQRRAVKVVWAVPDFLFGESSDARGSRCVCAAALLEHRERARRVWER